MPYRRLFLYHIKTSPQFCHPDIAIPSSTKNPGQPPIQALPCSNCDDQRKTFTLRDFLPSEREAFSFLKIMFSGKLVLRSRDLVGLKKTFLAKIFQRQFCVFHIKSYQEAHNVRLFLIRRKTKYSSYLIFFN